MATAAPPAPKKPTMQDYAAELKALPGDEVNAKHAPLTNAQVLVVIEYQIATKGRKATDNLSKATAKLLREAATAYPAMIDSLTESEKEYLTQWEDSELDADQIARRDDPKHSGLTGKTRFIYVTTGQDSKAQVAAGRKAGKGKAAVKAASKPKGESKPRRPKDWREGTFETLSDDTGGSHAFAADGDPTKGAALTYLGQWEDEGFYDKAKAAAKKKGFDIDTCSIVTLRGRYARISRKSVPVA